MCGHMHKQLRVSFPGTRIWVMRKKRQHLNIHTLLIKYLAYSLLFVACMVHADKETSSDPGIINHVYLTHRLNNQLEEKESSQYRSTFDREIIISAVNYCPGGTTSAHNNKCYWDGGGRSWSACETYCWGLDGSMICVDSAVTMSKVISTFSAYAKIWIGLNDRASEGTFVWSGGCTSSYRDWWPNQPNGGTTENCIAIEAGKFHDYPCATTLRCVCESNWTSEPSQNPSAPPSPQPTNQPSLQPSAQPTKLSSVQPSSQPSMKPTSEPTVQPSVQPSVLPSVQPSNQPSMQPSSEPTLRPSAQPSIQPTARPSAQPTSLPSLQPSAQPSVHPSNQPSSVPSVQPSKQPSGEPSGQPSAQPTMQPSVCPSTQSSTQPSSQPSQQPTNTPSKQPTIQPTRQPSQQPYAQPSRQPTGAPSEQPTSEWFLSLPTESPYGALSAVGDFLWACNNVSQCEVIDAATGTIQRQYTFPNSVYAALGTSAMGQIIINGHSAGSNDVHSDILRCNAYEPNSSLQCEAIAFSDTLFAAVSYVPYADKIVYVGHYSAYASATILNTKDYKTDGYVYAFHNVKSVVLSQAQSPPNFVGSFVAGTGVQTVGSPANYIIFGRLRVDSGALVAMSLTPTRCSILNSAELVNAMALEYLNPDSFIAGGLQLSDGQGMHAYLLRVNGWFGTVAYCVRYRAHIDLTGSARRALDSAASASTSTIKSVIYADNVLYILAVVTHTPATAGNATFVAVLQANAVTGAIVQQVSIAAPNGSVACTHITPTKNYLALLCALQSSDFTVQSVVISMDRALTIKRLPTTLFLARDITLVAESVPFVSKSQRVTTTKTEIQSARYAHTPGQQGSTSPPTQVPTQQPSRLPTHIPSTQPSSSPSAAPSVSPQPSSHPSSSGPTNTYKPTVKPTQRPSTVPSKEPTLSPTTCPTVTPTAPPSALPTVESSTSPSAVLTNTPTHTPSEKPARAPSTRTTRAPTRMPSRAPTSGPSVTPTRATARAANSGLPGNKLSNIIVGCVGGLAVVLWVAYCIYRIVQYCKWILHKDKRRVLFMQASDAPAELEHPILQRVVGCLATSKPPVLDQEVNTVLCPQKGSRKDTSTTITPARLSYQGRGAYMVSSEGFVDLEANTPRDSAKQRGNEHNERNLTCEQPNNGIANKPPEGNTLQPVVSHEDAAQQSGESVQSEVSESVSENDESRSEKSSSSSESASATESYFSSDRSNVLYSLSSDQESDLNDSPKGSNSEMHSSGSESDSHSGTEL